MEGPIMWRSCQRWYSGMRTLLGASVQRWLYLDAAQLRHWAEASSGRLKRRKVYRVRCEVSGTHGGELSTMSFENPNIITSANHRDNTHAWIMEVFWIFINRGQFAPAVIPWQKAAMFLHHTKYKNKKNRKDLLTGTASLKAVFKQMYWIRM